MESISSNAASAVVPFLRLSVVVPCFNEEESLGALHHRLSEVCARALGADYEIVLINDGSVDRTWVLMTELVARDRHVVAVNLSRNHGHQLALSAGLAVCRGARILIIDADLQDPPELLPRMMAVMDQGVDVVYGKRVSRAGETRFKKTSAAMFYRLLAGLTETNVPVDAGDFRLMSRRALDVLLAMPEQHRFIRGMVSWIGFRQEAIEYDRAERFAGETKYPLSKMLKFALDAITGFSTVPLRLSTWAGAAMGGLGLVFLLWTLVEWFSGATLRGWTSLMAVFLLLGSVQLLVLGIMGEYLGRLYMQAKARPLFIISDIVRAEPEAAETPDAGITARARA
jgi:polyisoprenyl-phosphate glycosyltransferase